MSCPTKKICVIPVWALAIGLFFGCRSVPPPERVPSPELVPLPSTIAIINDLQAQRELFLIFEKAYPGKISDVAFLNNDWTMMVNGQRFYFAAGRFLPEELREQWEKYLPYDFYVYPWLGTAEQRQTAFKYPVYSIGSSFLFDALYNAPTEDDSWELQVKYSFLGVKMLVHSDIKHLLDSIQDRIYAAAPSHPAISEWIAELQTSPPGYGWNWRTIAGTNRRSNHSYGTAIDLLPRDLKGRYTYWQWGSGDAINPDTHYLPPEMVVNIFEDHGFIWGGKWDLIDTMHFEYRPEILLSNFMLITK